MESDDFISLDVSRENHSRDRDDELREPVSMVEETESTPVLSQLTEEILSVENNQNSPRGHEGDDPNVLDMELEEDSDRPVIVFQESMEFVSTMTITQKSDEVQANQSDATAAVTLCNGNSKINIFDDSPRAKRARVADSNKQPSVRVIYNSLTRQSKRKLMELMQQWSAWQSKCQPSSNEVNDGILEDGEETYLPALKISSDSSCTMSFWIDTPARTGDYKDHVQLESNMVPFYDRTHTLGGTSTDGSANSERVRTLEASRCFNCGSYSHSLKECPKPRDAVAINNARKMHGSKRNLTSNNHGPTRYYQKAAGKFDDLKAGVLGKETRECLGIGEDDPPPWLHRMREMGYPPGYLDFVEDEDQPSLITIFADEEETEEFEDGELPERAEPEPPQRRMTVGFPGINSPIPENADNWRWGTGTADFGPSSFRKPSHQRSNHSSESHGGTLHDERRTTESRDDVLPSSEYGLSSPFTTRSPRYSPYDHNRTERTPTFERSLSDRGRWSPVSYDTSHSSGQQSPMHHSPSHGQWTHENSNNAASSSWPSWQSESRENKHKHHHHR